MRARACTETRTRKIDDGSGGAMAHTGDDIRGVGRSHGVRSHVNTIDL